MRTENIPAVTFRMYADVRFDRPVEKDRHFISPGGYEMTFSGKNVQFDFDDYEGFVDEEDNTIVHFMQKNPSYDEFKDLYRLNPEDLYHLQHIDEFSIYTGENCDPEINPVKIEKLSFRSFGINGQDDIDEIIDYSDSELVRNCSFAA